MPSLRITRRQRTTLPPRAEVEGALTLPVFREWLSTKGAADVVGYLRSEEGCPLSGYLNERVGAIRGRTGWWTSATGYSVLGMYSLGAMVSVPLPRWAKRFVAGVDALPRRRGWGRRRAVTRDVALEVLALLGALAPEVG